MQIDRVSAFSAGAIAPVLSNKRYLVSNAIYFRSRELKMIHLSQIVLRLVLKQSRFLM